MKRLPFFSPGQRRALLVVEWVLLLVIVGLTIWKWQGTETGQTEGQETARRRESVAKPITYATEETPIETFVFDPNTADSTALLRLGLTPWQVRNIYRYRAQHGRYSRVEDFQNVPGLTVEQWNRLKPCIRIAPEFQYARQRTSSREKQQEIGDGMPKPSKTVDLPRDTFPKQEKLAVGETVDVGIADTTLLKKIPGIGSKRAARIVAYRNALGGFLAKEQVMEATEMPDSVLHYMTLSLQPVRTLSINRLSVQQLMKHPYITFYQAKAIVDYRCNKGELHSLDEMSRLENFRATDIDRLRHYVSFE